MVNPAEKVHCEKAFFPIPVKLLPKVNSPLNPVFASNALFPMLATELGITNPPVKLK